MIEPQEGMSLDEILDWASYAESEGYGYIFRSDHLLPGTNEEEMRKKQGMASPECWVTLGAIAARTRNIRFGPMVSPIGFRNPTLLARMACTLDSYSKGRMCLGLGAGWNEYEYKSNGYKFPAFKERRKQVEEGYKIVRAMTEGRRIDFDGEYFSAHVDCYPRPANEKVHLIGGGRNPRIVQTLASYVDEWNVFNCPISKFLKLKNMVFQCIPPGKTIEVSQMGSFLIAREQASLNQRISKMAARFGFEPNPDTASKKLKDAGRLCGISDEFVEQLRGKVDSGIQKFYFQVLDPQDMEMADTLTDTLKANL
jgi:hypothetical protein